MSVEKVETLVIGAGQAGLAMSRHLAARGRPHLVLERARIAERWRSERWDSLVANGPAWHDRFPDKTFDNVAPDAFASAADIVKYFEAYAQEHKAPLRCGVEVTALRPVEGGFRATTSQGEVEAVNVVAATGPFQKPLIPAMAPSSLFQLHSRDYRNPAQLPPGGVLVVGAGSSGVQIADELRRSGREVWLSVGPHDRPPRRYRGRDFVWWLGALGHWEARKATPGKEHVTIAVSGAHGGHTVDFRRLAATGVRLTGTTQGYAEGAMHFADDLLTNVANGDANHLAMLDAADAYIAKEGIDAPLDPEERRRQPDPPGFTDPPRRLDLAASGVNSILWATGYAFDFGWIEMDVCDARGRPIQEDGASRIPGLYFLGLPWLTRRASAFIWGVWRDAETIAEDIVRRRAAL